MIDTIYNFSKEITDVKHFDLIYELAIILTSLL